MRASVLSGNTTRRLVVNYRVDPDVLRQLLPAEVEPRLAGGYGIAGISFARIEDVRARFVPIPFGVSSDSAMHRIAVAPRGHRDGLTAAYVPRRDTSSLVDSLIRDRATPVERVRSRFDIAETDGDIEMLVRSYDNRMEIRLHAEEAEVWPEGSVFENIGSAVGFFGDTSAREMLSERGARPAGVEGKSAKGASGSQRRWVAQPLAVHRIESSFFDDESRFPEGCLELDHAFALWNVGSLWSPAPDPHGGRISC